MQGCDFEPAKDIDAFAAYKDRLKTENPDWSPDFLHKQALIVFNEEMYPLQVRSFFGEKNGDSGTSTGQTFQIMNGRLVNQHYDFFKMIDHATSEEEKNSMREFQDKAVAAKTGEKIYVLDLSALGKGGGVRYLDVYEKESEDLVRHKERIDLTGDQPDLTLEEAEKVLAQLETPGESEVPDLPGSVKPASQPPLILPEVLPPVLPAMMPVLESIQTQPFLPEENSSSFIVEVSAPVLQAADTFTDKQVMPTRSDPEVAAVEPTRIIPVGLKTVESEKPIPVTTADSFWFEVMAVAAVIATPSVVEAPNVVETPVPVLADEITSGSDPEVELVPTKTVFVDPKTVELVIPKTETPAPVTPVYIVVLERQVKPERPVEGQVVVQVPTRTDLVGTEVKTVKMKQRHRDTIKQPSRERVKPPTGFHLEGKKAPTVLPPLWQVKLEPLNDKEIPIWPRGRGGFDYLENNDALVLVVVTTFFLIANTTWVQRDDVFLDFRGSG